VGLGHGATAPFPGWRARGSGVPAFSAERAFPRKPNFSGTTSIRRGTPSRDLIDPAIDCVTPSDGRIAASRNFLTPSVDFATPRCLFAWPRAHFPTPGIHFAKRGGRFAARTHHLATPREYFARSRVNFGQTRPPFTRERRSGSPHPRSPVACFCSGSRAGCSVVVRPCRGSRAVALPWSPQSSGLFTPRPGLLSTWV
jgi:hypothetical protein